MKNNKENVKLHKDYPIVCVWPGTGLPEGQEQDLVDWFKTEFGVKVQFLEVIFTKPDRGDKGPEAGGRSDVFFAVHKEDVMKFAMPKIQIEARWLEDVLDKGNYRSPIYPHRVFDYPH